GEVASRAEAGLAAVRFPGHIPVPGRARRADLIDAAFLGGTAAHGIELDDGFTQGSVHPGCVVVPAALALACARRSNGQALMEAVVAALTPQRLAHAFGLAASSAGGVFALVHRRGRIKRPPPRPAPPPGLQTAPPAPPGTP